MARFELDQGKSPEMKAMARNIIAAQKKEFANFDPMDEEASLAEPRVT